MALIGTAAGGLCIRPPGAKEELQQLTKGGTTYAFKAPIYIIGILNFTMDKIFYTLLHIHEMDERPASFSEKVLVKLYEMSKFANMTTQEQYLYIRTLMAEVDERSQRRTAINKAKEQGIAEGAREKQIEIARRMVNEYGQSPEMAAEITGLELSDFMES